MSKETILYRRIIDSLENFARATSEAIDHLRKDTTALEIGLNEIEDRLSKVEKYLNKDGSV